MLPLLWPYPGFGSLLGCFLMGRGALILQISRSRELCKDGLLSLRLCCCFTEAPLHAWGGVSGPCVVPEAPAAPQQGAETSLCPLYLCSLTQLKNSLPLT